MYLEARYYEVIKIQVTLLEWVLTQYDGWPLWEKKMWTETHTEGNHVKTQGADDCPRGLRRNQPCWRLDLRRLASRTVRKCTSVVTATQSLALRYGNPEKLMQLDIRFLIPRGNKVYTDYPAWALEEETGSKVKWFRAKDRHKVRCFVSKHQKLF